MNILTSLSRSLKNRFIVAAVHCEEDVHLILDGYISVGEVRLALVYQGL